MKMLHRGEKGFTLIELLVVIAILGIIAAVVALNIGGFMGRGKEEAANTEAKQVQTAVIAYWAAGGTSVNGTVGPEDDMTGPGDLSVHKYLLNPALLQAIYTIENGVIVNATTEGITNSKWTGCNFTGGGTWSCG